MKKLIIILMLLTSCGGSEENVTTSPQTSSTTTLSNTTTSPTIKTLINPNVTFLNCPSSNISNENYELKFQINSGSSEIVNIGIFEQKNGENNKNIFFDKEYNEDIFTFPKANTVNEYSYLVDNVGNTKESSFVIEIDAISEDGSSFSSCEMTYTPTSSSSATDTTMSTTSTTIADTTTSSTSSTSTTTSSTSSTSTTTTTLPPDYPQLRISEVSSSIPEYNRDDWNHWTDDNSDCQNTRHEVLIEESQETVTYKSDTFCSVSTGKWYGFYTGQYYYNASDLDIDHFIPLKNAHQSGGYNWSSAKKEEFSNYRLDPDNLIAVNLSANRSKGAKGPDEWKPSNTEYWCEYAYDWIRIKDYWNLTATQAEWDALVSMINTCPKGFTYADAQQEPVVELPTQTTTTSTSTSTTTTVASSQPDNPGNSKNCSDFSNYSEAKTWFDTYYPYYGDIGDLDRDGDLIPCESLPGAP